VVTRFLAKEQIIGSIPITRSTSVTIGAKGPTDFVTVSYAGWVTQNRPPKVNACFPPSR
jgi:hypothetical protein